MRIDRTIAAVLDSNRISLQDVEHLIKEAYSLGFIATDEIVLSFQSSGGDPREHDHFSLAVRKA